jgi:hypothetical protein
MWRKAGKTADFHGCAWGTLMGLSSTTQVLGCNIFIITIDNGTFGQFRLSWVLKDYGKNKP